MEALATFLPYYLLATNQRPYFKKYGKNPGLNASVNGVATAATGAIGGAVNVFEKRSIIDIPTLVIAVVSLLVLSHLKFPEPVNILVAALVGVFIKMA